MVFTGVLNDESIAVIYSPVRARLGLYVYKLHFFKFCRFIITEVDNVCSFVTIWKRHCFLFPV